MNAQHPLDQYIAKKGLTIEVFCREHARISTMSYWRLKHGETEFSTKLLKRVADATGGEVTVSQLIEALPQPNEQGAA